jgi:menaquinone-dependent protoporphyrinogen oxidase
MSRVLIVYGTSDGQTARICTRVEAALRAQGHEPSVYRVEQTPPDLPFGDFDGAIVAGSIHMGKHQRALVEWTRKAAPQLQRMPNAMISVSLSAGRDKPAARREVAKCFGRFIAETGFTPRRLQPLRGALYYTRYGLVTKLAMLLISKMMGGDTDTSRDYEYTDWAQVEAFAREFGAQLVKIPVKNAA